MENKFAMDTRAEGVLSVALGHTEVPNHRRVGEGIGTYDGTASWARAEKSNIVAGMLVIGRRCGWYIIPGMAQF
jgi:hypothetical protein